MAVVLKAQPREDLTKSVTKEIRNAGRVPAVVYGQDKENKTVSVDSVDLLKTVRDEGRNAVISLDIENGETIDVMAYEHQVDPLKGEVIHADFYVVNMQEEMDVEVALHLEGEAPGVKEGGVLQQPSFELQVRAKPADIPEGITADVSALEIGDSLSIADLKVEGKFEFLDDTETTIATVVPPTEEEETTDEEGAEPELVGADKEEE